MKTTKLLTYLGFILLCFVFTGALLFFEKPVGSLKGTLVNEKGEPVANAKITIDYYPANRKTKSQNQGEFQIDRLSTERIHSIAVKAKGYQPIYLDKSTRPDEIIDLGKIVLKELEPNFYVSLWSMTKGADEKIYLSIDGAKIKEIEFEAFEVNLADYLKSGAEFSDLENSDHDVKTSVGFKKVNSWNKTLAAEDIPEFNQKVLTPLDQMGLYWIQARAQSADRKQSFVRSVLVNKTNLGFIVKRDLKNVYFYGSTFKPNQPSADIAVSLWKGKTLSQQAQTNAQGLLQLPLPNSQPTSEPEEKILVVATLQNQVAFSWLPDVYQEEAGEEEVGTAEEDGPPEGQAAALIPKGQNPKTLIYTDRPLYRPGHQVFFKGILKNRLENGSYNLFQGSTTTSVVVTNPKGDSIYEKDLLISDKGTFADGLQLEEDVPPGYYTINASIAGKSFTSSFEVDEYRKPEFKVEVGSNQKLIFAGDPVQFQVDVQYYFGAPVAHAELEYTLYRTAYFPVSEEVLDQYSWWMENDPLYQDYGGFGEAIESGKGKTDSQGRASFEFKTQRNETNFKSEGIDYKYTLQVTAKDLSQKIVTREGEAVVPAGEFFFSTRSTDFFAIAGQDYPLEVKTQGHDKKAVSAHYELKIEKEVWQENLGYGYENIDSISGKTNADGNSQQKIQFKEGGYYRLTLKGEDSQGRKVAFSEYVWVSGPTEDSEIYRQQRGLTLIPQKRKLQPGDTLKIFIASPVKDGWVWLTLEGSSLYESRLEKITGYTKEIEIPLKKEWVPNLTLQASQIGDRTYFNQMAEIAISPAENYLKVEIKSESPKYHPNDTVSYSITTQDAQGRPISADLSLGVVDESLYALKADPTNIQNFFWGPRPSLVATQYSFSQYLTGGIEKEDQRLLRKNFKDTAFWLPHLQTDEKGQASIQVKLPENLTTWRATAIAQTNNGQVGQTIQTIISSKELLVRLATPRFFRERDRVVLKALIQNETDQTQSVDVSLDVEGLELTNTQEAQNRTLSIAAHGVSSFDFTVKAHKIGKAKIKLLAKSATLSDGVELPFNVLPHGIEDHLYQQGKIIGDASAMTAHKVSINVPLSVDLNRTQLKITLDTHPIAQLMSSISYLIDYPYGCTEQTLSKFLPALAVSSFYEKYHFQKDATLEKRIPRAIEKGWKKLLFLQNDEGGWGWWKNDLTDAFMTSYALYGLSKIKGYHSQFEIPETALENGKKALTKFLVSHQNKTSEVSGFLNYVATLYGVSHSQPAVFANDDLGISLEILSQVNLQGQASPRVSALLNELEQYAMTDPKGGQHFQSVDDLRKSNSPRTQQIQSYGYFSSIETTAFGLLALIEGGSTNQLLQDNIVQWLLNQRHNGIWRHTRETAFVIYALTRYFENQTTSKTMGVLANYGLEGGELEKINVSSPHFVRPLQATLKSGNQNLVIENRLTGPLYYQTDLTYFSNEENLAASSSGFSVSREYLKISKKGIKDDGNIDYELTPLTASLQKGELLAVRLKLTLTQPMSFLMVADALPSGFEVIKDLELPFNNSVFSERTIYDDKVAHFFYTLPTGTHVFHYVIRPELAGTFHVMPTQAEAMYQPEQRASSAENILEVQ